MGYFSNGSEGSSYQSALCAKCVHQHGKGGEGCAVWNAHMTYNYRDCNDPESILHWLIPVDADNHNGDCKMFYPKPQ